MDLYFNILCGHRCILFFNTKLKNAIYIVNPSILVYIEESIACSQNSFDFYAHQLA